MTLRAGRPSSPPRPPRSADPARYAWEPRRIRPPRGSRIRTLRAARAVMKETFFPAGCRMPPHDHPLPKVTLTLAGGCREERGGRTFRYGPETLQLNPAGSSHAYDALPGGMRIFSVTLGPSWRDPIQRDRIDPRGALREPCLVSLGRRLHQEFLRPDDLSPLVAEELLTSLLDRLARGGTSEGTDPAWLGDLLDLVHDTFPASRGLSAYASEIGVDRSHLARIFRSRYRCTLGEYLRGLRVERARLLLMESHLTLAQVARESGFSDQSHMGRALRRLAGTTPGRLRRFSRTSGPDCPAP